MKDKQLDLSDKALYEINITKYFKYYQKEYLDLLYLVASYTFIFLMYDFMNFLNGETSKIFTASTWQVYSSVVLGCFMFYLVFYKVVRFT